MNLTIGSPETTKAETRPISGSNNGLLACVYTRRVSVFFIRFSIFFFVGRRFSISPIRMGSSINEHSIKNVDTK